MLAARPAQPGPSPGWREFLERHAPDIWACDFCVRTVPFQTLHDLLHGSARQQRNPPRRSDATSNSGLGSTANHGMLRLEPGAPTATARAWSLHTNITCPSSARMHWSAPNRASGSPNPGDAPSAEERSISFCRQPQKTQNAVKHFSRIWATHQRRNVFSSTAVLPTILPNVHSPRPWSKFSTCRRAGRMAD
jgi:hypothetical protein